MRCQEAAKSGVRSESTATSTDQPLPGGGTDLLAFPRSILVASEGAECIAGVSLSGSGVVQVLRARSGAGRRAGAARILSAAGTSVHSRHSAMSAAIIAGP